MELNEARHECDESAAALREARQRRARRELHLLAICAVALLYAYPPARNAQTEITIQAISLTLPLYAFLQAMPTAIAIFYILYMQSVIEQARAQLDLREAQAELQCLLTPEADHHRRGFGMSGLDTIILSSVRTPMFSFYTAHWMLILKDIFLWLVFAILPFLAAFLCIRTAQILGGSLGMTIWNAICLIVMALAWGGTAEQLQREAWTQHDIIVDRTRDEAKEKAPTTGSSVP